MIRGSNADCTFPKDDELKLVFSVVAEMPAPEGMIDPTKFV